MESVGSNSSPSDHHQHRPPARFKVTQPVTDRIVRALRHRLRLLHRHESDFFVLGATGNVYTVSISLTPSCSCPDRLTPCKHILFVFIRVLGLSLDDPCLRRRTLRQCQLSQLLGTPMCHDTLAGPTTREMFHRFFYQARQGGSQPSLELEDGATCPVCLEEMRRGEKVVACGTCRNMIHQECLLRWKRSSGKRSASCVICRARWRDRANQERYLNLSAYVADDDVVEDEDGLCGD